MNGGERWLSSPPMQGGPQKEIIVHVQLLPAVSTAAGGMPGHISRAGPGHALHARHHALSL